MTSKTLPPHKALCFDAFGTLVESGDNRQAWRRLVGHLPADEAGAILHRALIEDVPLEELRHVTQADDQLWQRFEEDLEAEVETIRWRKGWAKRLESLLQRGQRIALCSNLATPYCDGLITLVEPLIPRELMILSCEIGFRKPEPEIYGLVCDVLELAPADILFIGDTPHADIDGPQAFGMQAMHIDAFERLLQTSSA